MNQKKVVIVSLIIISFILLISSVIFFINNTRLERQIDPLEIESMNKEQIIQYVYQKQSGHTPFYYFIPIFAFFGIVVGALIYYIMNEDLEKKQKTIEYNTEVILKLLNPEERKVMKKIVENDGKVQQVEITYMEGYTKVKAHRIVEALVQKGILYKEALGKMRMIRMNKDFYEILKKK